MERHSLEPLAQTPQRQLQCCPARCWCILKVIINVSPLILWQNSVLTHALIVRQVSTVDDGCKHFDLTNPGDVNLDKPGAAVCRGTNANGQITSYYC